MNRLVGIILIAISAATFATLAIFGRYAFAAGLPTFTILFWRFIFSALVMAGLLRLRGESLPQGAVLWSLIGMGAIGYVGQAFCYFTAIRFASAGLVALLLYLYPTFVAILSALFLHERITRLKILALVLALLGTTLAVGPAGGQWQGIVFALASAGIYSLYIIIGSQVMKHVTAVQSSLVIFASAALASGGLMFTSRPLIPINFAGWAAICAIVVFATVIPVVTFLAGLNRIGATNAAMLSTLEPPVTVLLAAWLFGEMLKPLSLLGGGLILIASGRRQRRIQP